MYISTAAAIILGLVVYYFTRKKYQEPEEDAVLEMHNEALDLIDDIAEEEQEEITQALKSDEPEELLTSRINSRGGPL